MQLLSFILLARGHAAADMALSLVFFQHGFGLQIQLAVELRQPLGDIFMHRGFADAEMSGGTAHSGLMFDDV